MPFNTLYLSCKRTSLLTTLGESRSIRPLIFPGPSTDSALRAELRAAWRGRGAKAEAEAQRERTAMVFMMNALNGKPTETWCGEDSYVVVKFSAVAIHRLPTSGSA